MVYSYYTIRLERMYGTGPSGVWHQVKMGEKAPSLTIIISCHGSVVSSCAPASLGDPPMAVNPKPTDARCPLLPTVFCGSAVSGRPAIPLPPTVLGGPQSVSAPFSRQAVGLKSHAFHVDNIISSTRISERSKAGTCFDRTLGLYNDQKAVSVLQSLCYRGFDTIIMQFKCKTNIK